MTTVKDFKEAIAHEIRHWPQISFQKSKKHHRLVIMFGGNTAKRIFPSSASDWRAQKNFISDLRRALRNIGADRINNVNDN